MTWNKQNLFVGARVLCQIGDNNQIWCTITELRPFDFEAIWDDDKNSCHEYYKYIIDVEPILKSKLIKVLD